MFTSIQTRLHIFYSRILDLERTPCFNKYHTIDELFFQVAGHYRKRKNQAWIIHQQIQTIRLHFLQGDQSALQISRQVPASLSFYLFDYLWLRTIVNGLRQPLATVSLACCVGSSPHTGTRDCKGRATTRSLLVRRAATRCFSALAGVVKHILVPNHYNVA